MRDPVAEAAYDVLIVALRVGLETHAGWPEPKGSVPLEPVFCREEAKALLELLKRLKQSAVIVKSKELEKMLARKGALDWGPGIFYRVPPREPRVIEPDPQGPQG